jgi:N-hydroxyarylamine O-acetyltransferase
MDLKAFLKRINYTGVLEPTLETLCGIHRQHLLTIPYENLDIHIGRKLELNEVSFFEKLVTHKRGGWCYEMNGLLAWILRELGFEVQYLSGTVGREEKGDSAEGNHLVLLVKLERPYLVDVGFGDGILEPLPLQESTYRQGFLEFCLSQENERWTFHNHPEGGAKTFDFTLVPCTLSDFAAQCHWLQSSPDSGFVHTTVCQRFIPGGIASLRGAVLKTLTSDGLERRVIDSATDYESTLQELFGLELPDVNMLYTKVWQRHLEWIQKGGVVE